MKTSLTILLAILGVLSSCVPISPKATELQFKAPDPLKLKSNAFSELMKNQCLSCHNKNSNPNIFEIKINGNGDVDVDHLVLTSKVIVPGNPAESSLYDSVVLKRMPKSPLRKLTENELTTIRQYILALKADTTAPVLTISIPAQNSSHTGNVIISGTCDSSAGAISLSGALTATYICSNNSFFHLLNVSDLTLGANNFTLSQKDSSGNTGTVNLKIYKEVTSSVVLFSNVLSFLRTNCITCHNPDGTASSDNFDFSNEADFFSTNLFKAGDANSPALYRTQHDSGTHPEKKPNMPLGKTITPTQFIMLQNWIVNYKGPVNTVVADPEEQFRCDDVRNISISNNDRLTKYQILNSLETLFGAQMMGLVTAEVNAIPSDGSPVEKVNFTGGLSQHNVSALLDLSIKLAENIYANVAKRDEIFGSCASEPSPAVSCLDSYLENFGQLIFRRPLTAEEIVSAKFIYDNSGRPSDGFKNVLAYQLLHPAFTMHWNVGTDASNDLDILALTQYEIASKISFQAADTTPDLTLFNMAKAGQLSTTLQIEAQVRRLLTLDSAKRKFQELGYFWSSSPTAFDFSLFPAAFTSGIEMNGLQEAILDEGNKFMSHLIWDMNGGFSDLMISDLSFASHSGLAQIYNHAPVSGSSPAKFGDSRKGFLNRIPFLFSKNTSSSIIMRGVHFREEILCENIESPDPVEFEKRFDLSLSQAESLKLTNRNIIAHITDSKSCMACHKDINPTGNVLENFDSLGRYRTEETIFLNGQIYGKLPLNSFDEVPLWQGQVSPPVSYDGLADILATSNTAKACFSKKLYQYSQGTRSGAGLDACQMNQVYQTVRAGGGTILEGIVKSIASNAVNIKRLK
jgi:hypothetical protein